MNYKELCEALVEAGVSADIQTDDDGQIVIYTGLKFSDIDSEGELEEFEEEAISEPDDDEGVIDTDGD